MLLTKSSENGRRFRKKTPETVWTNKKMKRFSFDTEAKIDTISFDFSRFSDGSTQKPPPQTLQIGIRIVFPVIRHALPLSVLAAFVPVFGISAEKLSEEIPAPAKILASLNAEIVPGDARLSSTFLIFRTGTDGAVPEIRGTCRLDVSHPVSFGTGAERRVYGASVRFPSECGPSPSFWLETEGRTVSGTLATVRSQTRENLFSELSDLSDDALFLAARNAKERSEAFARAAKLAGTSPSDRLSALAASYRAAAEDRKRRIAAAMSEARKSLSYLSPVAGKSVPDFAPYVPNSARPYRKDTTDAIHHGWDVLAPIGTPVRAIADGIIVRTVSGFVWSDFEGLVRPPKDEDTRLKNLDIYRGNQVWLKTADGNVTFYSHLRDLAPGIESGTSVRRGEILGTVGVTGVPDKSYDNPHLHFEIQVNPHDGKGSGDILSVMRWDWLGKGLAKTEVRELTGRTFAE